MARTLTGPRRTYALPTLPDRVATTLALTGLMAFPVLLSVTFFSTQSLRLDEAQSLWQTSRGVADILSTVAKDVHVPLYHLMLHFWRYAFGDSVAAARSMSLLFEVLSIPAIYLLGTRAYSRSVGLFAALLLTLSPFVNWYGNEIRMYTLFTFLVILNQYFFLKIYQDRTDGAWVGFAATAVLGIYAHYFFFLNLAAQAVFFFFYRRLFAENALRRMIGIAFLVVLSFAPWAWYVYSFGEAGNQSPTLPVPTSVNLFSAFAQFLFGFQNDHLNTFFLSLWPLTILFGFLALRRNTGRLAPEHTYLTLVVFLSMSLAFVASFVLTPIFVSRYLIFTIPALYLLLSSLIERNPPQIAFLGRIGLVTLMFVMLAIEIVNPSNPVKENYREAAAYLSEHASAEDVIVLSAPFTVYPIDYYYRGIAPIETLPVWDRYQYGPIPGFNDNTLPNDVSKLTENHQYLWLLLSYDVGYQEKIKAYFDGHFERVLERHFSPGLDLYVYKVRYDTPPLSFSERSLQGFAHSPATTYLRWVPRYNFHQTRPDA